MTNGVPENPKQFPGYFSLQDKIACLDREIRLRKRTYPSKIAHRRMTRAKASHEIAVMTEILREYENLLAQQDLFAEGG